jgi:anaerobic ribonucleoside-triphosphate reductase activating protein
MVINVARTLSKSSANGPGDRYVLWVQGCPLACPGCWNPDTWSFKRKDLRTVNEVAEDIRGTRGIEGVTFTGGEPFAQAGALSLLARTIKESGLSVFIFTGFTLPELKEPEHLRLLECADILVTGRYIESLRSADLPWRGSSNQEVHFLSNRYGPESMIGAPVIEFHLNPGSPNSITGFPIEVEWRSPL